MMCSTHMTVIFISERMRRSISAAACISTRSRPPRLSSAGSRGAVGIWNVRAMPRWQIRSGFRPASSSPLNLIDPAVGTSAPDRQLKSVVLAKGPPNLGCLPREHHPLLARTARHRADRRECALEAEPGLEQTAGLAS